MWIFHPEGPGHRSHRGKYRIKEESVQGKFKLRFTVLNVCPLRVARKKECPGEYSYQKEAANTHHCFVLKNAKMGKII